MNKFNPLMLRTLPFHAVWIALVLLFGVSQRQSASENQDTVSSEPTSLVVLWTSGDPDVAHRVALMYAHGAKTANWFEEVRVIVWGPSQRILVGDKDLKAKIADMKKDGVIVEACSACAGSFGVAEALRELDLPVKPMGNPLTEYLKDSKYKVITF
jgi:hypothetical protein